MLRFGSRRVLLNLYIRLTIMFSCPFSKRNMSNIQTYPLACRETTPLDKLTKGQIHRGNNIRQDFLSVHSRRRRSVPSSEQFPNIFSYNSNHLQTPGSFFITTTVRNGITCIAKILFSAFFCLDNLGDINSDTFDTVYISSSLGCNNIFLKSSPCL